MWGGGYQDSVRSRESTWSSESSPRALSIVLKDDISKHAVFLLHVSPFGTWFTHNETTEMQEGLTGIAGEIYLFLFFRC